MTAKARTPKPTISLGDPADDAPPTRTARRTKATPPAPKPADVEPVALANDTDRPARKALSIYLREDLIDRIRGLVAHANYHGEPDWITTQADFATQAFEAHLDTLEAQFNNGQHFRPPRGRLKAGPGADGIERIRDARTKN